MAKSNGWEEYQDPMDAAGLGQHYYKAPECKYKKSLKNSTQKAGSCVAQMPCVTHEEICQRQVPAGSIGSCDYYCKRYKNYRDRHDDQHIGSCKAPDYYLDYGFKYCSRFRNMTYYKLTSEGRTWLLDTLADLQDFMEQGVVDRSYESKTNLDFNAEVTKKGGMERYYTGIECRNADFRAFAFATHPDAYRPKDMEKLPMEDLVTIATTPDLGEWIGRGSSATWEQAGVMWENMDVSEIFKKTGERILDSATQTADEVWDGIERHFHDL